MKLPCSTGNSRGSQWFSKGNHAKVASSLERLSIMLCCSATGKKLKPLVIGNAARPRAFKQKSVTPDNLPVTWKHNKKAWMTTAVFEDWLNHLNETMKKKNRRIILFVDNAGVNTQTHLTCRIVFTVLVNHANIMYWTFLWLVGADSNRFTLISNVSCILEQITIVSHWYRTVYTVAKTFPLSFVNARYTRGTIASCVWRYHITSSCSIHSGRDDAILEPTDPVFSQFTRATTAQQPYIVMDVQQRTKLVRQRAAAMSSLTRIQTYIYAGERKMNDLQTGYENLPSIF